ncbi:helix-turn-helix transcriptional regulator [Brachybacterium sp. YJGR34]|uniref:helix-turn-helix transcriptional regulator n=1 Tax=Brachybacterium sp. YJGR34 TaxID=2059911 RepID=UPI000E0C8125|nr:helix-turn-helix transcriptional regulator [Brachybacterium sp. YJGR34]
MEQSEARRKELGAFLRARREAVTPQQAGLPDLGRRRTPGLRREEVAQLAGIGATWYTWLEQGRAAGVSDQVLEAVARVLRLSEAERRHMLVLADRSPALPEPPLTLGPEHLAVLEQLLPFPAAIQDDAYEIVATNRAYRFLFSDLDAYPVQERNCAWLMFTDPVWRGSLVEEERVLPEIVGRLRAHRAEHHGGPRWSELVERLSARSEDFRQLWGQREVADEGSRLRAYRSPRAGLLSVHFQSLWIDPRRGTRLVVMSPADTATRERLERHAALLEAAPAWTAREGVAASLAS